MATEAIDGYKTTKCIKKEGSGANVVEARDTVTGTLKLGRKEKEA